MTEEVMTEEVMTEEEAIAANELLRDQRVAEEHRQSVIIDMTFAREQCTNLLKGSPDEGLPPVKDHEERGRLIAIRVLLNDALKGLAEI